MTRTIPSVVVLAGPNGAGKSTVAPELLRGTLLVDEFVNPDVIAQGLSGFAPAGVALHAARMMLERLRELASLRASFAFETTLASRSYLPWLRELSVSGYAIHLVYVWLPTANLAVQRVAERVRMGGHDVPDFVIRRRYTAGLRNFRVLYRPVATSWRVYDNATAAGPRLVASRVPGRRTRIALPAVWRCVSETMR